MTPCGGTTEGEWGGDRPVQIATLKRESAPDPGGRRRFRFLPDDAESGRFVVLFGVPATLAASRAGLVVHAADVAGARALGVVRDLELHVVAPLQRLEALHLDHGVVHEHVLAAAVRPDEP